MNTNKYIVLHLVLTVSDVVSLRMVYSFMLFDGISYSIAASSFWSLELCGISCFDFSTLFREDLRVGFASTFFALVFDFCGCGDKRRGFSLSSDFNESKAFEESERMLDFSCASFVISVDTVATFSGVLGCVFSCNMDAFEVLGV